MKRKLLLFLVIGLAVIAGIVEWRFVVRSKPILLSDNISQVTSGTIRGYSYWVFNQGDFPCGKQGDHQFMVIQKGAARNNRNLLVRFTGGFAGFFYPNGQGNKNYFPDSGLESLLSADSYFKEPSLAGLDRLVVDTSGWRLVAPSYCSHDFYLGTGQYNSEDGFARWGKSADEQALTFVEKNFPTDKIVTYGTSAGAMGAYIEGISHNNVVGIVMDSFAGDLSSVATACEKGIQPYLSSWPCTCNGQTCVRTLASRIGFNLGDEPYRAVSAGQIKVPLYLIWDQNDYIYNSHTDLQFNPLAQAIKKANPGGKSEAVEICVDNPQTGQKCGMHSPTLADNPATRQVYDWVLSVTK
ncbi:hypothetical protein M1403_03640 [Patescibacteria group bacterium]|nr:hypothetical protein [Patescibacteria group bacterium]